MNVGEGTLYKKMIDDGYDSIGFILFTLKTTLTYMRTGERGGLWKEKKSNFLSLSLSLYLFE